MKGTPRFSCYLISVFFLVGDVFAEETHKDNFPNTYSVDTNRMYPMNVYWGDTHLHTNLSVDAYNANNKLSPDDAYRLALGEVIEGSGGVSIRRRRPLDFLVIADHAENMGLMTELESGNQALLSSVTGKYWYERLQTILPGLRETEAIGYEDRWPLVEEGLTKGSVGDLSFRRSIWNRVATMADQYNNPGVFTAFVGYEWTSMEFFIHRVVLFKDSADKAGQVLPFSQFDSDKPEDLWAYLEDYSERIGGDVFAIPHNGNLSRGHMFTLEDSNGRSLTRHYAQMRSRWEPLFEVAQEKGDSETHPSLSPTDEFADFETQEWHDPKKEKALGHEYEYARSALKLGLGQQAELGVNPFKFGMIASTDNHLSMPGSGEYSWDALKPLLNLVTAYPKLSSSGYAAVWSRENTRESIFAAMKRKETYATTGSRITVRFFGGWEYDANDVFRPNFAQIGYHKGVPMGGDLTNAPKDKAPSFLIRAVKDPDGANLDRVQVIKGWRDKTGELHEKIYDVALSDDRTVGVNGKVQPVGNTVDVNKADYINSIGDPELAVMWQDPDFDRDEQAFYYVRVLEIPTPRWTTSYMQYWKRDYPKEVPTVIQQRAYTSAIWFSPAVQQEVVMTVVEEKNR